MGNDDLITTIKERFRQGESGVVIRKDLTLQGHTDQEIDKAIRSIQHEAIKQLPVFSHFFRWFENPQIHAKLNTPRMTALILAGCIAVVLVLLSAFLLLFDPFNLQAAQRDKQRGIDLELLKDGLAHYYTLHSRYPSALVNLTPDILQNLPKDPSSGKAYDYASMDNGDNFQLCITFEAKSVPCIYRTPPDVTNPNGQIQTPQ
ncbi:MAG: hypothetical protein ACREHC_01675 [Candidatus Levyibacteriota bacterium]